MPIGESSGYRSRGFRLSLIVSPRVITLVNAGSEGLAVEAKLLVVIRENMDGREGVVAVFFSTLLSLPACSPAGIIDWLRGSTLS